MKVCDKDVMIHMIHDLFLVHFFSMTIPRPIYVTMYLLRPQEQWTDVWGPKGHCPGVMALPYGGCRRGLLRCRVVVTHVIWIHGPSLCDHWKHVGWVSPFFWFFCESSIFACICISSSPFESETQILLFKSYLDMFPTWWPNMFKCCLSNRGKSTFGVSPYGAPPYPHHWNDKRTLLPGSNVANVANSVCGCKQLTKNHEGASRSYHLRNIVIIS